MNVPNFITVSRVVLALATLALLYFPGAKAVSYTHLPPRKRSKSETLKLTVVSLENRRLPD